MPSTAELTSRNSKSKRRRLLYQLLRQRTLASARLLGKYVVLIDGTGYLIFRRRHCERCLTQRHGEVTVYMHQVLEAKLLGPGGLVFSIATEFIDNRDASGPSAGMTTS